MENNNEIINNNLAPENNNNNNNGLNEDIGELPVAENGLDQIEPEQINANPEHPSFITLTWTFVSSFFSSIIPETRNAL